MVDVPDGSEHNAVVPSRTEGRLGVHRKSPHNFSITLSR